MGKLFLCLALLTSFFLYSDSTTLKRPLDLPYPGEGLQDSEEDSPEVITFYSNFYEGDCFVWCLDKLGSMNGEKIATLKQEVTSSITQLSANAQFGLVAFSDNVIQFTSIPVSATLGNKTSGINWTDSLNAGGVTCAGIGGVAAVQLAYKSTKISKTVIFVSDGRPVCNGLAGYPEIALNEITLANYQSIPIHTLYIASNGQTVDTVAIQFMQNLAAMNSGTFSQVN